MNRLVTLTEGRAMVVTDLHGDWELYRKYRDHFLNLQSRGEIDYLIFTGDLIHSEESEETDKSLEIVLDVMDLKKHFGDRIIYLLGNHEMPHLYAITLQKGNIVYTPRFEARMKGNRSEIIALFDSLPFFVRTKARVSIAHAGAAKTLARVSDAETIINFSHQALWAEAKKRLPADERPSLRNGFAKLNRATYDEMALELLGFDNPNDPRYDDLLISSIVQIFPDFDLLWETLFNKNEYEYGENAYSTLLDKTLETFSKGFVPQNFLLSGHISCPNGYQIVSERQLRLASGVHAKPYESASYLVFDVSKPLETMEMVLGGVKSIFLPS